METLRNIHNTEEVTIGEVTLDEHNIKIVGLLNERNGDMDVLFQKDRQGKFVKLDTKNITANPELASKMYAYATDALMSYRRARRFVTRFVATDGKEREFYSRLVADLVSTGQYKIWRKRRVGSNMMWEIRRERDDVMKHRKRRANKSK
jgi:hypothetical protein